jgi:hypothetical protein
MFGRKSTTTAQTEIDKLDALTSDIMASTAALLGAANKR